MVNVNVVFRVDMNPFSDAFSEVSYSNVYLSGSFDN